MNWYRLRTLLLIVIAAMVMIAALTVSTSGHAGAAPAAVGTATPVATVTHGVAHYGTSVGGQGPVTKAGSAKAGALPPGIYGPVKVVPVIGANGQPLPVTGAAPQSVPVPLGRLLLLALICLCSGVLVPRLHGRYRDTTCIRHISRST